MKITKIKSIGSKTYEMYLDIINRKEYIEYKLRDNVEKRFLFSNLD